ncbi:Nucleotidylyl transferase [Canariomyces notabilis]|uniref:Nucleotidylyl transferase n=1 Tax=Canariomyces notabilis TaxID=2074819 RepID=A0AAN6TBI6_9PEZI|nr:Nucleotidylyl transferase [Canariomyces arenarius]
MVVELGGLFGAGGGVIQGTALKLGMPAMLPHHSTVTKQLRFCLRHQLISAGKDIWTALRTNKVANGIVRKGSLPNVARCKAGGSYNIGLKTEENGVVTRFPPEPSRILKRLFRPEAFDGKLIVRFDDTNPAKEKQELRTLSCKTCIYSVGIRPDRVAYIQQLYEICQRMIAEGNAYADDTDPDVQRAERLNRLPSKRRDRPKHCIRARIAFDSVNGAMRDPVIYCFPNISPTKARSLSIEGVTHALRTTEYADRNAQYQWFLKTLKLRPVQLWDFVRINFIRTFLSKRKLTKVVDTGITGWDDPRMPTLRGILRRGLTVPPVRDFMLKQGPSRNARVIDPVAPRHTAVETKQMVVAAVRGGPEAPYSKEKPKHPKNAAVGTKLVKYANTVLIDQTRRLVTWLAKGGSALVDAELWEFDYLLTKDTLGKDDKLDDFLTTNTAIMTEALCDANLVAVEPNSIIQLERKGYFGVDKAAGQGLHGKAVLFRSQLGQRTQSGLDRTFVL